MDEFLAPWQAARQFGVTVDKLRRLVREGVIAVPVVNGQRIYPAARMAELAAAVAPHAADRRFARRKPHA